MPAPKGWKAPEHWRDFFVCDRQLWDDLVAWISNPHGSPPLALALMHLRRLATDGKRIPTYRQLSATTGVSAHRCRMALRDHEQKWMVTQESRKTDARITQESRKHNEDEAQQSAEVDAKVTQESRKPDARITTRAKGSREQSREERSIVSLDIQPAAFQDTTPRRWLTTWCKANGAKPTQELLDLARDGVHYIRNEGKAKPRTKPPAAKCGPDGRYVLHVWERFGRPETSEALRIVKLLADGARSYKGGDYAYIFGSDEGTRALKCRKVPKVLRCDPPAGSGGDTIEDRVVELEADASPSTYRTAADILAEAEAAWG